MPALSVRDLSVSFETHDGIVPVVRSVSFDVAAGECLAIVGESGSGKSQTCLALLGLTENKARISGSADLDGEPIFNADRTARAGLRGARIGMIFQDPLTALTPHIKIGEQIAETLRTHHHLTRADARRQARLWLDRVRIPDAARRLSQYPHELSGGMRQRVMIACAMACEPRLLLADEPTTALDVTVQSEILEIMADMMRDLGTAIVLVTHDMGVVARLADRVCVMKEGVFVEQNATGALFEAPQAEYTRRLLDATPRLGGHRRTPRKSITDLAASAPVVLEGTDIRVHFPVNQGLFRKSCVLRAVDGVDVRIRAGETLGVVGESGCGKSTLARALIGLLPPSSGSVTFLGARLKPFDREALRAAHKDLQIVFQDPFASFDPRMTIGDSIAEPLRSFRPHLSQQDQGDAVCTALERVGLAASFRDRYPHEMSGGQNQRAGIARATIMDPQLIICDEAVSALDVSVRAQILDLLIDVQARSGLAMLFISHDLAVVREISHRVMVLYLGRVVEEASRERLYSHPQHPYTRALLAAALTSDPAYERSRPRRRPTDEPPSPLCRRAAFRFCPSRLVSGRADDAVLPVLQTIGPDHRVQEFDPDL